MNKFRVFNGPMSRTPRNKSSAEEPPFVAGLRHLSSKNNYNQKTLAAEMGVSVQTVSNIMRGNSRKFPTLEKAAAVFGMSYSAVENIGKEIQAGVLEQKAGSHQAPERKELKTEPPMVTEQFVLEQLRIIAETQRVIIERLNHIESEVSIHPRRAEPPLKKAR